MSDLNPAGDGTTTRIMPAGTRRVWSTTVMKTLPGSYWSYSCASCSRRVAEDLEEHAPLDEATEFSTGLVETAHVDAERLRRLADRGELVDEIGELVTDDVDLVDRHGSELERDKLGRVEEGAGVRSDARRR